MISSSNSGRITRLTRRVTPPRQPPDELHDLPKLAGCKLWHDLFHALSSSKHMADRA